MNLKFALLFPALLMFAPAPTDDPTDAPGVLDRVIAAAGGKANLNAVGAITWKGKGTAFRSADNKSFQLEASTRGMDHWRIKVDMGKNAAGMNEGGELVANSAGVWAKDANGPAAIELPKETTLMMQSFSQVLRLAQHPNRLADRNYTLTALGASKIDGKNVVGLRVAAKDRAPLDLFYDRKTYQPLRAEFRIKEPADGSEHPFRFTFAGHKKFDGINHFTTINVRVDDKKVFELELSDVKFLKTLPDATFAKP
jgi:hypothetical protein